MPLRAAPRRSFACPLQDLGVAQTVPQPLVWPCDGFPCPHPKGRQSLGFLKNIQRPFFLFFGCVVALMRSTLSRMSSTLGVSKDVFRVVVSNFWRSASARALASALPIFRRSASARALASALPIVSAIRLPFLEMGHYPLNLIDNCGLFSPARRHYEVRCIPTSSQQYSASALRQLGKRLAKPNPELLHCLAVFFSN